MIVDITAGYLRVTYRHYELKIVVFYRVILYTRIVYKMAEDFDDNTNYEEEEEEEEQIEMQERNKCSGEDTQPLLDNDLIEGHDNQGFQGVQTETSFTNDGASISQTDTSFMDRYIRYTSIQELTDFIFDKYGESG